MWRREITKENLIVLFVSAIIFIVIFIAGSTILLYLEYKNYNVFAAWCFITAIISMIIIGAYSYIRLRAQIMNYNENKDFPYNRR